MRQLAHELVLRSQQYPERTAVVDTFGSHTVKDVVDAAQSLAESIASVDIAPPTVVIQADNTWRTLAAATAVGIRGGLVAVVSPHAAASEFALALDDIDPDVVVASPETMTHWGLEASDFTVTAGGISDLTVRARPAFGDVERWGDGRAIAMTSGSTGRPKCVVQSEEAIRYAARCTIDAVGLREVDAIGAFVPLSSVAALCFGMYLPAMLGGAMVCMSKWSPSGAMRALREHDVAWTMLVPTMALQLSIADEAECPLTALHAMTVGGGSMNMRALLEAEEKLGTTILRVFGMSECLGHTTPSRDDPPAKRLGRDGRPFPGTVVRAVDADGAVLPLGETGDAQVSGPSVFAGYARDGALTRPKLTSDGFLPTGDLVEVDEDGFITVMGRKKQIIIRGGRNIDINEVEAAIAGIEGIVQVCVVPVPDDLLGERVAALVVTGGREVTLNSVTQRLAVDDFPKFKWPEFVFVVDDLPQNRVGKLSRPDAVALAARLVGRESMRG